MLYRIFPNKDHLNSSSPWLVVLVELLASPLDGRHLQVEDVLELALRHAVAVVDYLVRFAAI